MDIRNRVIEVNYPNKEIYVLVLQRQGYQAPFIYTAIARDSDEAFGILEEKIGGLKDTDRVTLSCITQDVFDYIRDVLRPKEIYLRKRGEASRDA